MSSISKDLTIIFVLWGIAMIGFFAFIGTSPIVSQTITVKAVYPSGSILTVVTIDGVSYGINYNIGAFMEADHTYRVEINKNTVRSLKKYLL
jgi:hypothetical protein